MRLTCALAVCAALPGCAWEAASTAPLVAGSGLTPWLLLELGFAVTGLLLARQIWNGGPLQPHERKPTRCSGLAAQEPDGPMKTPEELAADRRSLARMRAFMFVACSAGAPAFVIRAFGSGLAVLAAQLVGAFSALWVVLEFLDGTPLEFDDEWPWSYAAFGITLATYLTLTFAKLAHGAG